MSFNVLKRCNKMWGEARLVSSDPDVSVHSGVVYMPYSNGQSWWIYGQDGNLILDTVDCRGPDGDIHNKIMKIDLRDVAKIEEAPDSNYEYGGFLNPYYGHFIVNSLSRQWLRAAGQMSARKMLWHGPANAEEWFRIPFVKAIFGAIGMTQDSFVTFDRPTLIPRLVVPMSSFREQNFVHEAFGKLCRKVGRNLVGAEYFERNSRPTYLSKAALTSGVGSIINEHLIVRVLEREGIDIVFPERLSLPDQMRLFAERGNICRMAGSAMHTQAFWPSPGKVSILNATDGPNSNFLLIDLAANLDVD